MKTSEAIDILQFFINRNFEGESFKEAIQHAIGFMKRGAPDGWKLVPVEPTEEMVELGYVVYEKSIGFAYGPDRIDEAYTAMINAAPNYEDVE